MRKSQDDSCRQGQNLHQPQVHRNYDFEHIAHFARKRFVEGFDTVFLLQQASSQREKEEIALVCMLDVEENVIRDLQLNCHHADSCGVTIAAIVSGI